jgi:NAD(P)-dependent dehydrogenase (short-subunit alcohol dehydrogenase family)
MRKVAFVTGGARRLGRQIVYFLADEGYDLAINYNSSPQRELNKTSNYLKSKKSCYKFYKCDLRDLKALKHTVNRIEKDFGRIDLLVNNAGVIEKVKFEEITPKLYDDILNINLRAALFTCQFCLSLLKKSSNPVIINLASLGGLKNWVNYFPYCISKAGIIKLTYLLAKALAPKIRVNAIAPGTIVVRGEEGSSPEHVPLKRIPLKKYGSPQDVIEAVKFLLNCKYITGQVIVLDGGRTAV